MRGSARTACARCRRSGRRRRAGQAARARESRSSARAGGSPRTPSSSGACRDARNRRRGARGGVCATAVGHRKLFGDAETRGDPRQCATRAILSDAPHIAARRSRRASTASPTPRARVPIAMAEPRVLSFEVRPASSPSLARVVSRRVVVPPPLFPPPTRTRALMPDEPVPPPHRPAPSLVPTRRRSPVEA